MARTRQIRSLSCATLIATLLFGAYAVQSQEPDRAPDESVPSRAGRRGRGNFGGNPIRSALDSERPGSEEPTRPANDRDQVDTSRHERAVYRADYIPVQALATTLEKQFRGVPGLSLIAESVSNSLLISAPPERIKELLDTIRMLDRVPKSAAIEVTILDLPDVDASKEINVHDFLGASEKVRAKIHGLKKSGQIQRVRRFRVTALNNQLTSLQANADKPVSGAAAMFQGLQGGVPAGARQGNAARFPTGGTMVQCTARISVDKGVVIELTVHDAPANPDPQQMPTGVPSQFQGTLSIPPATTVVASEIATETEAGPSRVVILVSADVIEPPIEKPLAGSPR